MMLSDLPPPLRPHLNGYARDDYNFRTASRADVFQWTHPTKTDLFLKINDRSVAPAEPGLQPEQTAMTWLQGKLNVPRVVCFHIEGDTEYLLTTRRAGGAGHLDRAKEDPAALVREFARGLRAVHAVPPDGCPLDRRLSAFFHRAEGIINRMGADETIEGNDKASLTKELADLRANAPAEEDPVFVHGDYCLPNILVEGGRLTGIIDWGYAGVGDRYLDFAAAIMTIGWNLDEAWVAPFFKAYGLDALDEDKLAYYRRVYHFFE